jgi:hypothetical protein
LGGIDFAAQGAPDEFCQAQFLPPGFLGQAFLGLARQTERQ